MAINLFNGINNNIPTNLSGTSGQSTQVSGQAALRQAATAMLNELRSLTPGDTITGQLVAKSGNDIQLMLGNNTLLNTVLDQDVNVSLGGQMTFEVKSNHSGQLTLRPLFANLSNSTNIMNALDAAGIPASDVTIEMVDTLMQHSMPVNKELLQTINRELTMYPDAEISDIVMLHKMEIPVSDSSINQMHMYRNNNQWMMNSVSDAADELMQLVDELMSDDMPNINGILDGLKDILKPTNDNGTVLESASLPEGNKAGAEGLDSIANSQTPDKAEANINGLPESGQQEKTGEALLSKNITTLENGDDAGAIASGQDNAGSKSNSLDINKNNVFDIIKNLDPKELKNPEIRTAIKNATVELLKDSFLMEPDKVSEEKYVKRYYEKVSDITDRLTQLMNQTDKSEAAFTKTMTAIKDNMNFMNQVNDLYNYVQLPLKMNEAQANGDLYVYARKKGRGMGGDDGKLTALLRLSMEHLGNMDIFLSLQNEKLSTKFCLEKEELIDFIESHIDELNKRLIAKGYNIGTTVTKMDEPERNVIEQITKNDASVTMLSTQSFDARA